MFYFLVNFAFAFVSAAAGLVLGLAAARAAGAAARARALAAGPGLAPARAAAAALALALEAPPAASQGQGRSPSRNPNRGRGHGRRASPGASLPSSNPRKTELKRQTAPVDCKNRSGLAGSRQWTSVVRSCLVYWVNAFVTNGSHQACEAACCVDTRRASQRKSGSDCMIRISFDINADKAKKFCFLSFFVFIFQLSGFESVHFSPLAAVHSARV